MKAQDRLASFEKLFQMERLVLFGSAFCEVLSNRGAILNLFQAIWHMVCSTYLPKAPAASLEHKDSLAQSRQLGCRFCFTCWSMILSFG